MTKPILSFDALNEHYEKWWATSGKMEHGRYFGAKDEHRKIWHESRTSAIDRVKRSVALTLDMGEYLSEKAEQVEQGESDELALQRLNILHLKKIRKAVFYSVVYLKMDDLEFQSNPHDFNEIIVK